MSNLDTCEKTRKLASKFVEESFKDHKLSETEFTNKIKKHFSSNEGLYNHGWYEPPPYGIAALFSEENNFKRLQFDTLRKKDYWPKGEYRFGMEKVGIVYISPVDKNSGVIGDFGTTVYIGSDERIKNHLTNSLSLIEKVAEFSEVGMEFREIHEYAQKIFLKASVNNDRTVTHTDKVGTNIGHTIPWTYENPTESEIKIIKSRNFEKLKDLISRKRINVNSEEKFRIPENIAFTNEIRLEDSNDPSLPLVFFHLTVLFRNGKKSIGSNFNPVFKALEMDKFVQSKY